MSGPGGSPFLSALRRRLRPGTLLTGDRDDTPPRVPPRRTVPDLYREHERKAAARQATEPGRPGRHGNRRSF